jgi:hypothetical protein
VLSCRKVCDNDEQSFAKICEDDQGRDRSVEAQFAVFFRLCA